MTVPSRAAVRISDMELLLIATGRGSGYPYEAEFARDLIAYRKAMRRALKHIEEMNYDAAFETITRALGGKGK